MKYNYVAGDKLMLSLIILLLMFDTLLPMTWRINHFQVTQYVVLVTQYHLKDLIKYARAHKLNNHTQFPSPDIGTMVATLTLVALGYFLHQISALKNY